MFDTCMQLPFKWLYLSMEEGKVANFLLATTGILKLHYSVMKKKMLLEAVVFLLLISILRFSIELGLSMQAASSVFMNINPSWMLGIAKAHPVWAHIAEIVPMLALILLVYLLYKSIASNSYWGILKYVITETILSYMLIALHWAVESNLLSLPLVLEGSGSEVTYKKFMGDFATWEKAEASLTEAWNEFGKPWLDKIKQLQAKASSSGGSLWSTGRNEILSQVLPDRHGWLRAMGFGATATNTWGPFESGERVRVLEAELASQRKQTQTEREETRVMIQQLQADSHIFKEFLKRNHGINFKNSPGPSSQDPTS